MNTIIRKGDLIARIKNIFGNVVDEYYAPCSGIVSEITACNNNIHLNMRIHRSLVVAQTLWQCQAIVLYT